MCSVIFRIITADIPLSFWEDIAHRSHACHRIYWFRVCRHTNDMRWPPLNGTIELPMRTLSFRPLVAESLVGIRGDVSQPFVSWDQARHRYHWPTMVPWVNSMHHRFLYWDYIRTCVAIPHNPAMFVSWLWFRASTNITFIFFNTNAWFYSIFMSI